MKRQWLLLAAGGLLLVVTVLTATLGVPPLESGPVTITTNSSGTATTQIQKLDLRTATAAQLRTVPGIGETLAARIVEYRTAAGGFDNLYQLQNVDGISRAMVESWLPYLTLSDE